jgi:hypothetical protein
VLNNLKEVIRRETEQNSRKNQKYHQADERETLSTHAHMGIHLFLAEDAEGRKGKNCVPAGWGMRK